MKQKFGIQSVESTKNVGPEKIGSSGPKNFASKRILCLKEFYDYKLFLTNICKKNNDPVPCYFIILSVGPGVAT